jgi:hypothetical protein
MNFAETIGALRAVDRNGCKDPEQISASRLKTASRREACHRAGHGPDPLGGLDTLICSEKH